jgi:hypothetical protein
MVRALALLCVLSPSLASADTFKLFAEVHGGGMYGQGLSGAQKDSAFFAKSPNGTYGALIGGEFLFLDAWVQHHQFTDGSRLTTWTQFGAGIHTTFDTGDEQEIKEHTGGYVEMGTGLWFGIGTGQQVMPPLDNAQLSDKGFILEGRLGLGKHINKVFDLGFVVPVGYGFYFKNGAANSTDNQYRGWQVEALLALRANIRLL